MELVIVGLIGTVDLGFTRNLVFFHRLIGYNSPGIHIFL